MKLKLLSNAYCTDGSKGKLLGLPEWKGVVKWIALVLIRPKTSGLLPEVYFFCAHFLADLTQNLFKQKTESRTKPYKLGGLLCQLKRLFLQYLFLP